MRHLFYLLLLLSFSLQAQLDDLIITEYVDWDPGAGWAIKIFNPTNNTINLSSYYVQVYNGSNNSSSSSDQLSGFLAAGSSTIISNANNNQASSDFKACASNQSFNSNGVNDDDCIALTFGSGNTFVDMIGLQGTAVKNKVSGVSRALKWNKLVRENGNCTRYTSTDGSSSNSWPSSSGTNMTGFIVSPPTCLLPGSAYSPFASGSISNLSICQGDSILINGNWEKQAGSYQDTLAAANGCYIINSVNLSFKASPSISRTYTLCPFDSLFINNQYYLADTSFSFLKASSSDCDSIINVAITSDTFNADFDFEYLNADSTHLSFNHHQFGYNAQWFFGDGLNQLSSDSTTQHTYLSTGNFSVMLILTKPNGCRDTVIKQVYIPTGGEIQLVLPNIFSPNGDGVNDLFQIQNAESIINLQLVIFNRWGHILATRNSPPYTWDGQYQGQECTNGTYFYTVSYRGKQKKQTLTLQR